MQQGVVDLPDIPAHDAGTVEIPFVRSALQSGWDYWLNLDFTLAFDTLWADRGHEIANAQFLVAARTSDEQSAVQVGAQLHCHTEGTSLVIEGPELEIHFNTAYGQLTSWISEGVQLIEKGPQLTFWRATTDNDRGFGTTSVAQWRSLGLHQLTHRIASVDWESIDRGRAVKVVVAARIAPPIKAWGIACMYV
ncbi:hypothetical protein KSD_74580 [Ktedonobacter sp. SOSP1-85]|uniref:beta-galactosidase domain 4-containing protein n=1 Tax=Ktedonobacter sp. SOSP1-85 TaxID=2778367 RepID=UPI001915ADD6|nr:hypothetical protein KSD_74580 [Ktedonobacter sp. SOSP1-85]